MHRYVQVVCIIQMLTALAFGSYFAGVFADFEASMERKQKGHAVEILIEAETIEKRMKLMKQSLLYSLDSWGCRFPYHVRIACLEWLSAVDLARASTVCNSWKLSSQSEDRLWRTRYAGEFEGETGNASRIADQGESTPWKRRFLRRKRVDRNWQSGTPTITNVYSNPADESAIFQAALIGSKWLVTRYSRGYVRCIDLETSKILARVVHLKATFCAFENSIFLGNGRQIQQYSVPDLKVVRSVDSDTPGCCLATDGKRMLVVLMPETHVGLIDLATGKELWRVSSVEDFSWAARADFANDLVYVPRQSAVALVRLSTGQQLAETRDVDVVAPCVDARHGTLYLSKTDFGDQPAYEHHLLCLDSRTLERRGEISLPVDGTSPTACHPVSHYLLALSLASKQLAVVEQKKDGAATSVPRIVDLGEYLGFSTVVQGGASPLRVLITRNAALLELDFAANLDDA